MQGTKGSFGWNLAACIIVMGNLIGWGGVAVLVFNVAGDAKMSLGGEALFFSRFSLAALALAYGLISFIAFSFAFFVEGQGRDATWKDWLLTYGFVTMQIAAYLLVSGR